MRASNYLAGLIIYRLVGSGDPASWTLGLSSTTPAVDGTNITEPSGGGYARIGVQNDLATWNVPDLAAAQPARQASNKVRLDFPQATAGWGAALTCWVLFLPNGKYATSGAINALTVNTGGKPYFNPGVLVIAAPATGG